MGKLGNPMAVAAMAGSLTPKERKILAIGALALLAIGGIVIYRKIVLTKADKEQDAIKDALDNLSVNRNELTISEGEAMTYAQKLFDAMNRRGTDEDSIYTVLEGLKSKSDLIYVIKAFGAPMYGYTGESDSWFSKKAGVAKPLDLAGWLKAELSGNSLKRVQSTFSRWGVTF